jgi:POT family proton-dependent oligopeptide transporter
MAMNIGGVVGIGFSGLWSTPILSRYNLLISVFLLGLVAILFNQASKRMDFLGPDFLLGKLKAMTIGVTLLLTVFSVSMLMLWPVVANAFLLILVVFTVGYLLSCAKKVGQSDFHRMLIFIGLTAIAIFFFILYSLEPDVLAIFIHDYVNRHWLGIEIPASTYFMLNPLFNLIFGGLFFVWLTRFKKSFSYSALICFSIFLIGFGFWVLWVSTLFFQSGGISTGWIVTVYALLGLAEMLLAPVAYEIVFIYGFRGLYGMMMGLSQLAIGIGAMLAERISKFIVPSGYSVTSEALYFFSQGFKHVGLIWMGIGLFLIVLKVVTVWVRKEK